MVKIFDSGKLWYLFENGRYYSPCQYEVGMIASTILKNYGGIFTKGNTLYIGNIISSYYNVIVIKDHPCVILEVLGSGAYGKVFKAYDMKTCKLIAVKSQPKCNIEKIMKQTAITKSNGIGLADTASNLGPSFLGDGNGYFGLPLADASFDNWVVQKTVAGENYLIIKALIKIANDLIKLHENRKVHMDLKMDNILVVDNEAYISDFGESQTIGSCIPVAKEDYKNYPQCAPEYFSNVNKSSYYIVDATFDLFSYGNLIHDTGRKVRKSKISGELKNIATYIRRFKPEERKSLKEIVVYLQKLF